MKQAVRENRRGKVRVPEYLILDDSLEVALLRSRMEVCEEARDCYTRRIWFIGYAPEFGVGGRAGASEGVARGVSRRFE